MFRATTIDIEGYGTRVFDEGSGPPVVLIHGGEPGGSAAADIWTPTNLGPLSETCRVLALDRLGQGYTDNPSSLGNYRIGVISGHVAAFIRSRGVSRATLVGQSRGAYIAVRVARSDPDLVARLVLVNSLSMAPGHGARSRAFETLVKGDVETVRSDAESMSVNTQHISDHWVETVQHMRAQDKIQVARAEFALAAKDYYRDFERDKKETLTWVRAGGFGGPVLICWGEGDPLTTLQDGVDLYRLFEETGTRTHFYAFSRCGHYPFREHASEFNALVSRYARDLGQKARPTRRW